MKRRQDRNKLGKQDPVVVLIYRHIATQTRVLEREIKHTGDGLTPPAIHKMRIAIRRIRAVLRTFRDIHPARERGHLDDELKWLAKQLGHARDVDVCGEFLPEYREAMLPDGHGTIAALECQAADSATDAYDALTSSLASERYRALMQELAAFSDGQPGEETLNRYGDIRISDCTGRYATPALQNMLTHGRAIDALSPPEQLHKLRIEAKRIRYLLEFFAAVQKERWRKPMESAELLQDVLGPHQDACMARKRLETFAECLPADASGRKTLLDIGRLIEVEDRRAAWYREQFSRAWQEFEQSVSIAD